MKNVTITLDEETAAWVRLYAARRESSVSRVVGELLAEKMSASREYDDSMRRFLSKPAVVLTRRGQRLQTREEVNDRPGLR